MPAYVIVDFEVKDKEKLGQYANAAAETLIPFEGEYVVKGEAQALHGAMPYPMKVVIMFPNRDKAVSWYQSDAYQNIVGIRDQALNSQFQLVG